MKIETLPPAVRAAVAAAQEKKAAGIIVLDLSGLGAFTEYFVLCTAFSAPQIHAVCAEVEEQLARSGKSLAHHEGYRSAEWALLDFGSFIVHVFSEQARRYYDLERLWRQAQRLEIPDQPGAALPGAAGGSSQAAAEEANPA